MLSFSITFLLTINVIVCVLIVLLVLMQRPKSEGLGAAFGGGMTENLFGAQTTNVLANFTRWLGGAFFLISLLLSILYARQSTQHSSIQAAAIRQSAAATPAASPSPSIAPLTLGEGVKSTGSAPSFSLTPSTTGSAAQ